MLLKFWDIIGCSIPKLGIAILFRKLPFLSVIINVDVYWSKIAILFFDFVQFVIWKSSRTILLFGNIALAKVFNSSKLALSKVSLAESLTINVFFHLGEDPSL